MRLALLVCVSLFPALGQASACPDISGIFKTEEAAVVRFTQKACASLRIQYGKLDSSGKVDWYKPKFDVFLDGRSSCQFGVCWTGATDSRKILLSRDKAGLAYDPEHGDCSYREEAFAIGAEGVTHSQDVFQCTDGFSGRLTKVLAPLE